MKSKLFLLTSLLSVLVIAVYFGRRCYNPKINFGKYRQNGWFGVGPNVKDDSVEIRPFALNVSDAELNDLKSRLVNARFVDHIEDTQFTYGFNSKYLREVVEYWKTKYDWRAQESKLNSFPQFKTQIEGLDIHFVHAKPTKAAKTVLPLLVIHGWPGSFYEYYKSLPLLTQPNKSGEVAFEVIVPSIPGYGYSEPPHQKGFNAAAAARVFVKLMGRLGHERFVVHGGDWGNVITKNIAIIHPERVIAAHAIGTWEAMQLSESLGGILRTTIAAFVPSLYFSSSTREREYAKLFPLKEKLGTLLAETGYFHLQATKPDTVGAALVDSPVGLAAYILEKFSSWTNLEYRNRDDGGLTQKFSLDELLTNVMIYWTSGNVAASMRFYKENFSEKDEILGQKVTVPTGTVDPPFELVRTPRKLAQHSYSNLVQYTDLPHGGHFTAFEEPELVCTDLRRFVSAVLRQRAEQKRWNSKDEI